MEDTYCKDCIKVGSPIYCNCPLHRHRYEKLLSLCEKLYATRWCGDCSAYEDDGDLACEDCEAENAYDDYKKFKEENE